VTSKPASKPAPVPERRTAPLARADGSWFGALDDADDSRLPSLPSERDEAAPPPSKPNQASASAPAEFSQRRAWKGWQGLAQSIRGKNQTQGLKVRRISAFERIYRTFVAARAALGFVLLLTLFTAGAFGGRPPLVVSLISLTYTVLAMAWWRSPGWRQPVDPQALSHPLSPRWLGTIGVDVVCFVLLHVMTSDTRIDYVALFVLPVLMAGVLTPRLMALFTVSAVALALLATAWLKVLVGGEAAVLMTQAGLAGSGLFVITVLAGELAGRLAREQLAARGSLELARQQAQLNQLVIEEMQDGVLVVDRRGRVRAANPASGFLLSAQGPGPEAPFQLRGVPAWEALVSTVERAFSDAVWPGEGRDVTLVFGTTLTRTLRVRVRFTLRREPQVSEAFCVLFLEDVRNMQARSRQEKLAAMGRVSAGIAHEIRNPLAAIAQANALLSEDLTDPTQKQLARMVADNVGRLKRIVDDVMEVAPGMRSDDPGVINVCEQLGQICREWAQAVGVDLGKQGQLQIEMPSEHWGVIFDSEHLRRVLVNLLDNAHRHASQAPGCIQLRLESRDEARVFLGVSSDGEPIAPDVERYLFEPFFSTRSRGTGLGLYICRELCERYGASIDYRRRELPSAHGQADLSGKTKLLRNEFYLVMRRSPLPPRF
jgi:two-component system, NtrC family, sensor histidine kinase PilS